MQKFLVSGLLVLALAAPASAQSGAAATGMVDARKEGPLRFYGFGLDFSLYDSSNLNTIYYTNTLDYWLLPSWQLGQLAFKGTRFENLTLTGRFIMNSHLAGYDESSFDPNSNPGGRLTPCSNLTPSAQGGTIDANAVIRCPYDAGDRRTTYSDLTFGVLVPRIAVIPVLDISINPAISVVAPVSRESRFTTLRTTIGASLGLNRAFFGGKLRLGYIFGASKNFHESKTAQASARTTFTPGGDTINGEILSNVVHDNPAQFNNWAGAASNNWGMNHIFRLDVAATEKLSFGALFWMRQGFKYELPCNVDYGQVQGYDTCGSGGSVAGGSGAGITTNPTIITQIFSVSAGYQLTDYLGLSLAMFTVTPQKRPDNSYRQPFLSVDASGFTSVSLGATVSLEKAAARLF